jgi:NAD(P)-dependent dehydrogenase (short-subunit alcohol dehydrogenase family)
MDGRTAIITGASSGLGLECTRDVLRRDEGWHVVLAVRDRGRGEAAAAALDAPRRCTVMVLDLASLASVRAFLAALPGKGLPRLHAVVCNAAVQVVTGTRWSADGIELTFATNHLGHFALVNGILDQLEAPARIAVVSSDTHDPSKGPGMPAPRYQTAAALAHPGEEPGPPAEVGRRRYTTSKLCNVLFAYELDRRLGHGRGGIAVNAFNPGFMPGSSSNLARDYTPLQRVAWRYLLPVMRLLPNVHSARTSGRSLAALVADPALAGVTGRYYDGDRDIQSSPDSYDLGKAADLWRTSEELIRAAERGPADIPGKGGAATAEDA